MNEEGKQLHIRMPKEDYKKLKMKCVYEDISMQEYVSKLIAESLSEYSTELPSEDSVPKKPKYRH